MSLVEAAAFGAPSVVNGGGTVGATALLCGDGCIEVDLNAPIGALAAREGQANMGAYIAAKSTVMRLTETLAKELRESGINVNAVLPSIIDTPANRAAMADADFGRWVDPQDLAEAICFLGSERARAIHGALLPVAGLS